MDVSFVKNKALLAPLSPEPHAFARFRIDAARYPVSLTEDIALGQSLGAWEPAWAENSGSLERLVAKIISVEKNDVEGAPCWSAVLAFPWSLWHGQLHWLLTLLFGKMSFYEGIQLSEVWFSPDCFAPERLQGPRVKMDDLRHLTGASQNHPLLMGILKPNVAMSDATIVRLYLEVAGAGIHLLKDDEIRFDANPNATAKRVEAVATAKATGGLKTLYAVHLSLNPQKTLMTSVRRLENAGADAFLFCPWTMGLGNLQELRTMTALPLLAHPALAGAFGISGATATIHPRVLLAQLLRAAGADMSLFPSPYGKLGLAQTVTKEITDAARDEKIWPVLPLIPVPSAGIQPEHAPLACRDFGTDFILNAGTAVFAGPLSPAENVARFQKAFLESPLP